MQINKKILSSQNTKYTAALIRFISAIWTTISGGCQMVKDDGRRSARWCRRIGQSLHGVGSTPAETTYINNYKEINK